MPVLEQAGPENVALDVADKGPVEEFHPPGEGDVACYLGRARVGAFKNTAEERGERVSAVREEEEGGVAERFRYGGNILTGHVSAVRASHCRRGRDPAYSSTTS